MDVINLNPSDKQSAASVITRAFYEYPMIQYYWPDQERKARHLEWYFECAVNYGLRYGVVYTNPETSGLSIWLPPGRTKITTIRYLISGYLRLPLFMGWENFNRAKTSDDLILKVHSELMPNPHWYLWIIAVDPDHQGEGIGSRLLSPGLEQADMQNLPCYVETHAKANDTFYTGSGFELVHTQVVPGGDLTFWCYRRAPRPG